MGFNINRRSPGTLKACMRVEADKVTTAANATVKLHTTIRRSAPIEANTTANNRGRLYQTPCKKGKNFF